MNKIRIMGRACLREAETALKTVKKNRPHAQDALKFMKTYQLYTEYYAAKVAAAIAATIYPHTQNPADKDLAEKLADESLARYLAAATFAHENIDPVMKKLYGVPVTELIDGKTLPEMIEDEKSERRQLAQIFKWPQ